MNDTKTKENKYYFLYGRSWNSQTIDLILRSYISNTRPLTKWITPRPTPIYV